MWRHSSRCDNLENWDNFINYCFSHSSSCPRLDQEEMPWFHWKKNEWPTNSPDLRPLDYHVWDAMLGRYQKCTRQNWPTWPSWRLPCCRYWMICHRSSLIRQSCHFERDFDRMLLQLVDILNTQLNTERAADIRHWNVWTIDEKVVQSLISYYWIFRTRLHVLLKKWTLKFKLLYTLNHICYFNKKCRVCGLNPQL